MLSIQRGLVAVVIVRRVGVNPPDFLNLSAGRGPVQLSNTPGSYQEIDMGADGSPRFVEGSRLVGAQVHQGIAIEHKTQFFGSFTAGSFFGGFTRLRFTAWKHEPCGTAFADGEHLPQGITNDKCRNNNGG